MAAGRHPTTFGETGHGPDVEQNAINWANNASNAITGFLKNPLGGVEHPIVGNDSGGSGDDSSAADSKAQKAGAKLGNEPMTQPPTPAATDVAALMKPLTDEIKALPDEYSKVMSQINAMPDSGTSTPVNPAVAGAPGEAANLANAVALTKTEGATTADLEGGEGAIHEALANEGKAAKTLVKDLPYADILATSLLAKKNQLLGYGTTPNPPKNEAGWPQYVKDIYSYIQGGSGGNTVVSGGGGISIPASIQAFNQDANSGGGAGTNFGTSGQLGSPSS